MATDIMPVIDLLTYRPESNLVALILTETRDWGPDGSLILDLQAKLKAYVAFVEHGVLDQEYPQYAGKPVVIRLDCASAPGEQECRFLERVTSEWLDPLGIGLEVGLLDQS